MGLYIIYGYSYLNPRFFNRGNILRVVFYKKISFPTHPFFNLTCVYSVKSKTRCKWKKNWIK